MNNYLFGDIVVINRTQIGIIVKCWTNGISNECSYDVYNRMTSEVETYDEYMVDRYKVRHKYLSDEELVYQEGY